MFSSVIPPGGGKGGGVSEVVEQYVTQNLLGNQLISGSAVWLTGLTFQVSDCIFSIDGQLYTSAAEQVTLGAADGSNPRIDVIAVNIDGTADVVAGTAAADPVKPETDPNTQVEVTFVLVATGATTPSNVSNEDVYLENTEWTSAESGATVDPDDTSDPQTDTKAVLFDAAGDADFLTLTDSVSHAGSEFDALFFSIKNTVAGTTTRNRLRIALYDTANRVSDWIDLRPNQYGFDAADVADYQLIQIPLTDFSPSAPFNRIRFQVEAAGAGTLSFLLDDIKLQSGAPVTSNPQYARIDQSNAFTKAQGSAITVLTDAATVAWDMSVGNVFQLTLGGNRTIAAPTGIIPGFTYNLFLYQSTGSHTATWNSVFKWAGGVAPTLSTDAGAVDVLSFMADASGNLHGTLGILDSQ
jgi:hypothetical protein